MRPVSLIVFVLIVAVKLLQVVLGEKPREDHGGGS
jgi:hypothetical protein